MIPNVVARVSAVRVATWCCAAAWVATLLFSGIAVRGAELAVNTSVSNAQKLETAYAAEIRPLMQRYCHECHGAGDTVEGDINLAKQATWADISGEPKTWQKVSEMLSGGLMPPEDAKQPTLDERAKIEKWVHDSLALAAASQAGDPGPVVIRRLSNAEYTYTLRDLTGVASLDPAREFPVDGAAGEGFMNAGNALVMSPALVTKYFDAAKDVAGHMELLPDGIRFSPHTTSRDWTDDLVAQIRVFYGQFSVAGDNQLVTQQGVALDVGQGGRIPLTQYFAATLAEREAIDSGAKTIDDVARERGLSAKYLQILWTSLTNSKPSLLLDGLRAHWRAAKPGDEAALANEVAAWQKGLWTFASVGLIGRVGGPKQWLEPVDPLVSSQEVRLKIPESADDGDVVVSLVAGDAGDGNEHDLVVWQRPRLVAPGRPDLLLRDVRHVASVLAARREQMLPRVAAYLQAADEVISSEAAIDVAEVAKKHGVEDARLRDWLAYLGVGSSAPAQVEGLFTGKLTNVGGFEFINGWGSNDTPSVIANSTDQQVRVPGIMRPHGVCVHPSQTLRVAAGWRSPVTAAVRIEAHIALAHPECSNGVTWSLELRRSATRQQLASGIANQAQEGVVGPLENVAVRAGDMLTVLIGPLGGNHSCDLTAVDFKISTGAGADAKTWSLSDDVAADVLAANPHADKFGNAGVWHFYAEPDRADAGGLSIPAGSLLAKWQIAGSAAERERLAAEVQQLLAGKAPADRNSPDGALYRQKLSFGGPLLSGVLGDASGTASLEPPRGPLPEGEVYNGVGVDPALFGKTPSGRAIDDVSLCVQAPSAIEIRLPASLVAGCELVATAELEKTEGVAGSVQVHAVAGKSDGKAGLQLSEAAITESNGQWTDDNRHVASTSPILVAEKGTARERVEAQLEEFRQLFPAALCYTKIVPVDEVVTMTLFYREDAHLQRLMLDEDQTARLERLWDELHFVSQDALKQVDVLEQVLEFATQDADPKAFEPLKKPTAERAAAFRQQLVDAEPKQLDALIKFAARVYRRPLTKDEADGLRKLYASLRAEELPHDQAIRLTFARMLVSPAFLYRAEKPEAGTAPVAISDWELANRLSYFLWSSEPDDEVRALAAAGKLHEPAVLGAQTQRMLKNAKVRRMATEFACQWLSVHDFDKLDEKSDRHFPTFVGLRGAMYEESIEFFTHLFNENAPVLDILAADYTYLNEDLAKHYGVPGVSGPEWRRVDGMRKYSRGGVLGQATTLAKQSGASRTSPILRGNWVSEVLLGEKLPKPPKGVPPLPDDEADTAGLTVRQLVEKHVSDPKCAGCHERIDAYGFALENFDAIGRFRDKDLGDRPIDAKATTMDGAALDGFAGLQNYLLNNRRDAFLRQFCRKLLGYALGRAVQLSDEPLLAEMQSQLAAKDYRVSAAVEAIVASPQFLEIRGKDVVAEE